MINQFYSSLVISHRHFPHTYQVLRPRYNKEFFKRLTQNIDRLEKCVRVRCSNDSSINPDTLDLIKKESKRFVKLKDTIEKYTGRDDERQKFLDELDDVQNRLLPTVVSIPNRFHQDVPRQDIIIHQLDSDFLVKQNLTKVLSYTKLSYINNCYSVSVVGPNSNYHQGIGAKLQYGLNQYFHKNLERYRFIPTSGLCLAKSALVEASHSKTVKDYMTDPCRIISRDSEYTTSHLVEASRESLMGFVTTIAPIVSNNPLRLMTSGSAYRNGSKHFDGNVDKVSQYQTVHALSLAPSIERYSIDEFHSMRDTVWEIYKPLEMPCRLIHCSLKNLASNEFDAYRIDFWLPSKQEWIEVSRISHYLDYITIRTGMKRGHIIDSMVYDGQALSAAIIENRQTASGKFIIPAVLKDHMMHLTDEEKANYFGSSDGSASQQPSVINRQNNSNINYDQRRYLVKKSTRFSHAKSVHKHQVSTKMGIIILSIATFLLGLLDWEEIWMRYLPKFMQRFLYDKFYRPLRRLCWSLIYPEGTSPPPDLPFDEIDKSLYSMTMFERRRFRLAMKNREAEIGIETVRQSSS